MNTRLLPILVGIGWLTAVGLTPAAAKPLIGLSVNVPAGGGAKELMAAIQTQQAAHVGLVAISAKWSDLEPRSGIYTLKPITDAVHGLPPLGFRLAITIQTLDSDKRTLPADLQSQPFSSPTLRKRFKRLLTKIAPELTAAVCNVNLGSEADNYLAAHPGELEAYAGCVEAGRAALHALRPALAVGVTTTFGGLGGHPEIFRRLNQNMDIVALTYYPLTPTFQARPVSVVAGDFDRMAAAAGPKPLALTAAGYPAAPLAGSSERQQAAFVDAVFSAAQKHAATLAFVNFLLMYDLSPAFVDTMLGTSSPSNPRFRAFLSTMGLRHSDGTPRRAWQRFQAHTVAWSRRP